MLSPDREPFHSDRFAEVCNLSQSQTALLTTLLPTSVAVAEQFGAHVGTLSKEEKEVLGEAAPKRQLEFAAGRNCAREALKRLGLPESPILRGKNREPLWPDGVVGSITHCQGYCAAAVAYGNQIPALGIDAEPDEPLPEGVLPLIARKEEIEKLANGWSSSAPHPDRILFSAKESTYKAWYPLTNRWLDFDAVRIDLVAEHGSFDVTVLGGCCVGVGSLKFSGRYMVRNGLILTAVITERN